eukprot:c22548_g1_i1 orf=763-1047(+)
MQCLNFPNEASESYEFEDDRVPLRWVPRTLFDERKVGEELLLVFVPPHPLIKHWLSVLRNELSPVPIFRSALAELGRFLIYEAARDWLVRRLTL